MSENIQKAVQSLVAGETVDFVNQMKDEIRTRIEENPEFSELRSEMEKYSIDAGGEEKENNDSNSGEENPDSADDPEGGDKDKGGDDEKDS